MFQLSTNRQHYDCLSTDVKETEGITVGSTCTETDTEKEYTFDGAKWVPVIAQSSVILIVFQAAATAAENGQALNVGGFKSLTVGITSAAGNSALTLEFHGVDAAENDNLITGVNKNGLSPATGTSNSGETWQFDITGLVTVYMKLTSITGGNVTVSGLAVA